MTPFGEEFYERYPKLFPPRKLPRVRRRYYDWQTRKMEPRWLWWLRTLLPWLWTLVVGPPTTRQPVCGAGCGVGWWPILHDLFSALERMPPRNRLVIDQVKEKMGGLRVYPNTFTTEVKKLIHEAERRAWRTCETCGAPGKLRRAGWLKVRCDACQAAFEESRK